MMSLNIKFFIKEKKLNNKQYKLSDNDLNEGMNEVLEKLDEPFPVIFNSTYLVVNLPNSM